MIKHFCVEVHDGFVLVNRTEILARHRLFYVEGTFKYQSLHVIIWSFFFLLVIRDENFDEAARSDRCRAAYACNME